MTHARGTRVSYFGVETVLGLIGMAVFIVCVIALAASVTWLVVKISPNPEEKRARKAAAEPPAPS
jgi:Mn2+/Fe2+ NRAMP family transporter